MGYSTEFEGKLSFTSDPTGKQLAALSRMLGEDCRDHPEWNAPGLHYIDLKITDDFSGLEWNRAEKTYYLEKIVNVVLVEMRKQFPEFGLTGSLAAQGEDVEDRWTLKIGEDGMAHKIPIQVVGKIITCPYCDGRFEIDC